MAGFLNPRSADDFIFVLTPTDPIKDSGKCEVTRADFQGNVAGYIGIDASDGRALQKLCANPLFIKAHHILWNEIDLKTQKDDQAQIKREMIKPALAELSQTLAQNDKPGCYGEGLLDEGKPASPNDAETEGLAIARVLYHLDKEMLAYFDKDESGRAESDDEEWYETYATKAKAQIEEENKKQTNPKKRFKIEGTLWPPELDRHALEELPPGLRADNGAKFRESFLERYARYWNLLWVFHDFVIGRPRGFWNVNSEGKEPRKKPLKIGPNPAWWDRVDLDEQQDQVAVRTEVEELTNAPLPTYYDIPCTATVLAEDLDRYLKGVKAQKARPISFEKERNVIHPGKNNAIEAFRNHIRHVFKMRDWRVEIDVIEVKAIKDDTEPVDAIICTSDEDRVSWESHEVCKFLEGEGATSAEFMVWLFTAQDPVFEAEGLNNAM